MQGTHGDQLDMLGLGVHALLESHSLCVGLAAQSRGTHLHTSISRALVHATANSDVLSPGKLFERAISCIAQTAGSAQSACFGHVQALVSKRRSSHVAGGRTFKHVTCLDSRVARSTTITILQNRSGNSAPDTSTRTILLNDSGLFSPAAMLISRFSRVSSSDGGERANRLVRLSVICYTF